MALLAGDSACSTGLAKAIYDGLVGDAACGFSSPMSAGQTAIVKAISYRVAVAVVTHLTTNGVITVATTCGAGAGTGTGTIS